MGWVYTINLKRENQCRLIPLIDHLKVELAEMGPGAYVDFHDLSPKMHIFLLSFYWDGG